MSYGSDNRKKINFLPESDILQVLEDDFVGLHHFDKLLLAHLLILITEMSILVRMVILQKSLFLVVYRLFRVIFIAA